MRRDCEKGPDKGARLTICLANSRNTAYPLPTTQASSPDEEALVQGAAYLGYRLEARR